jgi:hypothetical protein
MALPIQETPVLHGEDARRFAENAARASSEPVSKEEYNRAVETYNDIRKKSSCFF